MGLQQERERIYYDRRGRVALSNDKQKEIAAHLESMYNKGDLLKNADLYEKDVDLRQKIKTGQISTDIETGKQGKHIKGHNNYIPGRSYLTVSESEIRDLVNKYAGTGRMRRDSADRWAHKEAAVADKIIGVVVDPVTGKETETRKFIIHYSKKGVHIVPSREE